MEQTLQGVAAVREWSGEAGELEAEDLLISANVDEGGHIVRPLGTELDFLDHIKDLSRNAFDDYVTSPQIMSRSALHQLKWCEVSEAVISGGLWSPLGNFDKVI